MAVRPGDVERLIVDTFRKFDLNKDGTISRAELGSVLRALQPQTFDERSVDLVLTEADTNRDGRIQYEEFVRWVMAESRRQQEATAGSASLDYRSLLPQRFEVDISRRYALDKLALGEGGYGKVYVARDSEFSSRLVAVKKVVKSGDPKRDSLVYNEIDVMRQLDHPGICKLLETFEEGRAMFFVLEYCEGGEVFNRIIERGRISEADTVDVIRQVAAALCYAHGRSIAHRDVKPENIVYCTKDPGDSHVKLIDWGLGTNFAKCVMRSAVGSFTYAAPEVLLCREVFAYTSACDLWSLGVVAYVMLCGTPPFWGTESQHLRCAQAEQYPMSGPPWDAVSDHAKDFIRNLLRADPANRLTIQDAVAHPWLQVADQPAGEDLGGVVANLRRFTNMSLFSATCVAAVSRQLDHRQLRNIHQVFRDMDRNGDGVLSLEEIAAAFRQIFGEGSAEYLQVAETFRSLDLDASGVLDYTEFCAAGLGQHTSVQEDALWAAFKAFDVDDSGDISAAEFQRILQHADVKRVWTPEVCAAAAAAALQRFDHDGDGKINFGEWKGIMQQSWERRVAGADPAPEAQQSALDVDLRLARRGSWAYGLLQQVSLLVPPAGEAAEAAPVPA